MNESSIAFFSELGRKIASISGDNREPSFLFQRISSTIQRFNSILLHNSLSSDEEWPLQLFVSLLTSFVILGIFTPEGIKNNTFHTREAATANAVTHTSSIRSVLNFQVEGFGNKNDFTDLQQNSLISRNIVQSSASQPD